MEFIQFLIGAAFFGAGLLACVIIFNHALRHPQYWARGLGRLEWRPWELQHGAIILLGTLGLGVVVAQIMKGLLSAGNLLTGDEAEPLRFVVIGLAVQLAGVIWILAILRKRGISWSGGFDRWDEGLSRKILAGLVAYMAVMPIVVLTSTVSYVLLNALGIEAQTQELFEDIVQQMTPMMMTGSFILAVVGAPISEELLFRGIALPLAAKYLGPLPAILLVSMAFALVHLNAASFLPLLVLAIGLSLAYIYTQSIWVPIIMHACFNAVNLTLFFLTNQEHMLEAVVR